MAGRTDTGVHAWGQVVSFDARPNGLDPTALQRSLNGLGAPVVVVSVGDGGRATASTPALGRSPPLPLHRAQPAGARPVPGAPRPGTCEARSTCACCGWPAIRSSASTTSPRSAAGPSGRDRRRRAPSLVRRVSWTPAGPTWATACCASRSRPTSFCHQMVRSVVGTLVEVGRGRRTAGEMLGILAGPSRRRRRPARPAHGLCLWEVGYDRRAVGVIARRAALPP